MNTVSIDNLADAIVNELENYSESITTGVKVAVDTVAKEVNAEIKAHVTFTEHSRKYVKAFRIKSVYDGKYNKGKTWYVANGQYRLTHLLEKGHAKIGGGRTDAFPHIIFGNDLAIRRMQELSKEAIENAGH
ncbi:hypothetical protein [Clostridium sp.]|uniref:hypothetical protein n=1 Tax=Clostridium sp. TaxID=1506 RepID=UPI001A5E3F5C|nr:hypothetical protein [Clostridium sp.]MBK5235708.1 hypothetical protein [Clostridium sp.]